MTLQLIDTYKEFYGLITPGNTKYNEQIARKGALIIRYDLVPQEFLDYAAFSSTISGINHAHVKNEDLHAFQDAANTFLASHPSSLYVSEVERWMCYSYRDGMQVTNIPKARAACLASIEQEYVGEGTVEYVIRELGFIARAEKDFSKRNAYDTLEKEYEAKIDTGVILPQREMIPKILALEMQRS